MKKILISIMACLPCLVFAAGDYTPEEPNYVELQGMVGNTNGLVEWQVNEDWAWQLYTIEAQSGVTWTATVETVVNVPIYTNVVSTLLNYPQTNSVRVGTISTTLTNAVGTSADSQPFDYAMTRRSLLKVVFSTTNAVFRIVGIKL